MDQSHQKMDTCEASTSGDVKSDSELLSKSLDEVDLAAASENSFLDFENFSKFYEVMLTEDCL